MRRLLIAAVVTAGLIGATGGTASADPVKQPYTDANCHGWWVAQTATADPEGIGNFFGGQNVKGIQRGIDTYLCC